LEPCIACHGPNGQSQGPNTPSLGGQPAFFAMAQLFLYREGRRPDAQMAPMAKGMSDADLRKYSDAIARLPPPAPPAGAPDAAKVKRGREIAAGRHCVQCHGEDYEGYANVPRLAHQREDYLLKALRDFASGRRIGYGNAAMAETVAGLSDEDLAALAHLLAYWKR
jgi:cytochrome c553